MKVCHCTLPNMNPNACENCGNNSNYTYSQTETDYYDFVVKDDPIDKGKIIDDMKKLLDKLK